MSCVSCSARCDAGFLDEDVVRNGGCNHRGAHAAGIRQRLDRLGEPVATLLGQTAQPIVEFGSLALAAGFEEQQGQRDDRQRHPAPTASSPAANRATRARRRFRRRPRVSARPASRAQSRSAWRQAPASERPLPAWWCLRRRRFGRRRRTGSGVGVGCSTGGVGAGCAAACCEAASLACRSASSVLRSSSMRLDSLSWPSRSRTRSCSAVTSAELSVPEPALAADSLGGTRRRRPARSPLPDAAHEPA